MTVAEYPTEREPIPPKEANGVAHSSDWEAPEPFDVLDVPAFPVASLPSWLGEWASALAEFAQVPVDMPASIGLAAASLAAARHFLIDVRPGWEEPCNLWIVVAAPPADRKSPIFKHATEAVHAYAEGEAERLAPRIRDLEIERHILAGQLESAKSAAVKGKPYDGGDAHQAARELASKLADLPVVHVPTLVTDDCTAEALAAVLAQNGERLGIFSAEGGPFELMAGRYAERGTNFEMFLKAHTGDHHIVHRIKRDAIFLTKPLLTVAMTVQPSVIAGLHGKDGFRGRGLLARFLYSLPQSLVGKRAIEPVEVPEDVRQRYNAAIGHLLAAAHEERRLVLTPEADALRCSFQGEIEPKLGPDGDLEAIGDWAGKLTGAVCRIAGVLHVSDYANALHGLPEAIPAETVARAIQVGRYFLAHATAAFQAMGADEETELAKRVWRWVRRQGKGVFTEREAYKAAHVSAEELAPALAKLAERNLIRPGPKPPPTGGKPASQPYEVSPLARRTW